MFRVLFNDVRSTAPSASWIGTALLCVALTACGARREPAAPGTQADRDWGPVQVVVYKGARKLVLYRHGKPYREYRVWLGFKPGGRKRYLHDARTPEGYYHFSDKRPHDRWQYFISFDYPNRHDRRNYARDVSEGRIPTFDGVPLGIGGNLGIHGTDKPTEHENGVDWTKGCIAMDSDDILELVEWVDVGTPLWILE